MPRFMEQQALPRGSILCVARAFPAHWVYGSVAVQKFALFLPRVGGADF